MEQVAEKSLACGQKSIPCWPVAALLVRSAGTNAIIAELASAVARLGRVAAGAVAARSGQKTERRPLRPPLAFRSGRGASCRLDVVVLQRNRADAPAGRREVGVEHGRRGHEDGGLADAAPEAARPVPSDLDTLAKLPAGACSRRLTGFRQVRRCVKFATRRPRRAAIAGVRHGDRHGRPLHAGLRCGGRVRRSSSGTRPRGACRRTAPDEPGEEKHG